MELICPISSDLNLKFDLCQPYWLIKKILPDFSVGAISLQLPKEPLVPFLILSEKTEDIKIYFMGNIWYHKSGASSEPGL